MKKLLSFILAFLLVASVASAANIPRVEDPRNGPGLWTIPVFNNSGITLSAGDVVLWDIDASTGDNDNYVTTTTTADTGLVAGVVVGRAMADQEIGTIAVRGVVTVNVQASSKADNVDMAVCTSATRPLAKACDSLTDVDRFGYVTAVESTTNSVTSITAFINVGL